jgi:PAS domain S-box-containing protein
MSETPNHIETINRLRQQLAEKEVENNELVDRIDKYRHASEGANDGLWDWDLLKNRSFVSKPWKTMLGFEPGEELELHGLWESLLHPEDKQQAVETLDKFVASKKTKYNSVFRLRHKDGTYKWIRSKALAKIDDQGVVYRISGAHIDITEHRKMLNELTTSREKYKALFQNSLVAIFRSKIETGEVYECNNEFLKLLGIGHVKEFSTMDYYYNPEDREEIVAELKSEGKIQSRELKIRKANGEPIWVSFSSSIFPEEGVIECVLIDITESVRSKGKIKSREEKYQMLFENSVIGIIREDMTTGQIIDANRKMWELLGETGPVDKKTLGYYVDPQDRARLIKSSEDNRIENFELQVNKATGEKIWLLINTRLFPNENISESIAVDITQSKLDTIELQKVNFELDSFVYHSSHDLRSPLRSILGLINIYRHEDDQYLRDEYIDRIERSINKLDHLVKELLSISRNDRVDDPHVEVQFMVEIDHSVDGYYNALDTDNLSLETKVKQPFPFVTDLTRVKVILNNIISNAIKYRDTEKELSKVIVDIETNKKEAIIKVIDNGEGIPKDQIPHIFDMFHRASDHSEGSGLGLYIVKNVANKLNAKVSVVSEPYVETIFTITIPNNTKNVND